jgi:hypothetical protein
MLIHLFTMIHAHTCVCYIHTPYDHVCVLDIHDTYGYIYKGIGH